jgi:four helix bundle protein
VRNTELRREESRNFSRESEVANAEYKVLRRELEQRTKMFAINTARFVGNLPPTQVANTLGKQLLRSATSVGANYRSAARARSKPDFISKISIAEEEADETQYWLEILHELSLVPDSLFEPLHREAGELTAIFVSSGRTAKNGK